MTDIISFDEAINDSDNCSKRHLLIGNGFSIACKPDIFHYGSIFGAADFSQSHHLEAVFEALETQDFEVAIRNLEAGSRLIPIYAADSGDAGRKMQSDAGLLKEILLNTIAGNHPDAPNSITNEQFSACKLFLSNFLSGKKAGQIFTLNYDLLLYWTLMHDEEEEPIDLIRDDGFGNDEDDPDADYVVWQGEVGAHKARVHFLHGALHLFDAGSNLQKFTWIRTNQRLIEQAQLAMEENKFPLFVAEGTSVQKKSKIRHNAYLYQGLKQLTSNSEQGQHCFFIHGHSLDESDNHILKRLARGHFKSLYVSIYGDPNNAVNQLIIAKAENLSSMRKHRYPLKVCFYDSQSANVWG